MFHTDMAPTAAGAAYTSTQFSQVFPAGSQITFTQAVQLVSTPSLPCVGAGASLVSEDTEIENILSVTPEVTPDTAATSQDPLTLTATPSTTSTWAQSQLMSSFVTQPPVPARAQVYLTNPTLVSSVDA